VLLDFNKATLKPESGPVLQHVQALTTQNAALKLANTACQPKRP
jgi:hypothetical protein